MPQCQAKAKSTGIQCQRSAVAGKRVCTVHGGLTPGGIASANYKTGKYSKYLPDKLASRYEAAANDPNLLELNHEIGLMDMRLTSLLERVNHGETGLLWQDVGKLWQQYKDKPESDTTIKIDTLIKKGHDDYQAWGEIGNVIEQRRKLVESERKRLVEAQQYVTAVQAMTLIGNVLAIIKDNVTDRPTLQAISQGINQLVTRENVIDAG